MLEHPTAFRVLGWIMTLAGLAYLAAAGRGLLAGGAPEWPALLIGLTALVVGSALVRWARRAGR